MLIIFMTILAGLAGVQKRGAGPETGPVGLPGTVHVWNGFDAELGVSCFRQGPRAVGRTAGLRLSVRVTLWAILGSMGLGVRPWELGVRTIINYH